MGNQSIGARKNYWSLDVAKFICALTIISAHFATEWGNFPTLIDYAFSIYVIAVPFFFCCSGFLFFKKLGSLMTQEEKNSYFVKYQKRLWVMYGLWSLVYLPFQLHSWATDGNLLQELLEYIHRALVIQTYATIWFLPALAVGTAISYFLVTKLDKKWLFAIAVILYVIGMFGHTYKFLLKGSVFEGVLDLYLMVFKTSRNGVFNAVPFVLMGYFVSVKETQGKHKGLLKYSLGTMVFLVLLVIESFALKLGFKVTGMDIGIFIVPFTYCLIMAALNIELKDRKLWMWCRELSLGIFLSQRLFLSAIPVVFPVFSDVLYDNSYLGLLIVIALTVAFSVGMILLGRKYKFFKMFI